MRAQSIAVVVLAFASACSTMTMRIPRSELQADLAKRFPLEADKQVVRLRASEPQIEFPGKPDVLAVRLRVDAIGARGSSGSSHLRGTTRAEGRLEYVAAEHAFYLRDPKVTELSLEPSSDEGSLALVVDGARDALGAKLIERAARSAVEELLRHNPVYRLDAKRSTKEAKAIRHLRSVHISGQDLVLEVGL